MDYTIELTFETDMRKTMMIPVPNAKPGVTDAEVKAAMKRIIDAGAVSGPAGAPAAVKKAEMVAVETTDYSLR